MTWLARNECQTGQSYARRNWSKDSVTNSHIFDLSTLENCCIITWKVTSKSWALPLQYICKRINIKCWNTDLASNGGIQVLCNADLPTVSGEIFPTSPWFTELTEEATTKTTRPATTKSTSGRKSTPKLTPSSPNFEHTTTLRQTTIHLFETVNFVGKIKKRVSGQLYLK